MLKASFKDLFVLALILAIWFGIGLNRPLSNPDESRYTGIAQHMVLTGNYDVPMVNGVMFLDKPPLSYWLEAAAIKTFGNTPSADRFFPAVFAWLGCLIICLVGQKLYSRRAGFLSAVILATTLLYVAAGHYTDIDLEVGVCIGASLGLFFVGQRAVQNNAPTGAWFFWAAIFAALGLLFKGLIGIVLPGMVVVIWIIAFFRWRWITKFRWLMMILVCAIIAIPYYAFFQLKNPQFLHYFFIVEQFQRYTQSSFNNVSPPWFYILVLFAGFFPWSLLVGHAFLQNWRDDRKQKQKAESGFLWIWVIVIFVFFSVPASKLVGYIIPVLPALALGLGRYCDAAFDKEEPRLLSAYAMIAGVISIAGIIAMGVMRNQLSSGLVIGGVLASVLVGLGAIWVWKQKSYFFKKAFMGILFSIAAATVCALIYSLSYTSPDSVVAMVNSLKQPLPKQAVIAVYHNYFEDLPIAFPNTPTRVIAHWGNPALVSDDTEVGHFAWALPYQPAAKAWLMTDEEFWKLWSGNATVEVFLAPNLLPQFQQAALAHYHEAMVVANTGTLALVNNVVPALKTSS